MLYSEFIVGCNTYRMRLTMQNLVLLERRYGESPISIIARFASGSNFDRSSAIMILHYSLMDEHSLDDTYAIYDDYIDEGHEDVDFAHVLVQLFKDTGFFSSFEKNKKKENNKETTDKISKSPNDIDEKSLEESFDNLLLTCLKRGMTEEQFWKSTYGEITRWVEADNFIIDINNREKAFFDHRLANLIGSSVACLISNKASYPSLEEAYPNIFDKENEELEEMKAEKEKIAKVEAMRARMIEYMRFNNANRQLAELKKRREEDEEKFKDETKRD